MSDCDCHHRATEWKFLIDAAAGDRVREWARQRLEPDPFGMGPHADEYDTCSLYWDTPERDVLHGNGSYGRAKYRVRRYGQSPFVFLERKLRRSAVVIKRRAAVPLAELRQRMTESPEGDWAASWFRHRVRLRGLHPACYVSYRRMARRAAANGMTGRLTLDDRIRASPADDMSFECGGASVIFGDRLILELKFPAHPPALFKHLIEELRLTARAASKYRTAICAVAGMVPVGGQQDPHDTTLEPSEKAGYTA